MCLRWGIHFVSLANGFSCYAHFKHLFSFGKKHIEFVIPVGHTSFENSFQFSIIGICFLCIFRKIANDYWNYYSFSFYYSLTGTKAEAHENEKKRNGNIQIIQNNQMLKKKLNWWCYFIERNREPKVKWKIHTLNIKKHTH